MARQCDIPIVYLTEVYDLLRADNANNFKNDEIC